jgi:azurin
MMRPIVLVILSATAIASLGCQKSAQAEKTQREPAPAVLTSAIAPLQEPTREPAPAATGEKPLVELELASVGDTMAFDKTKLTVPAGSRVHLVLKNRGTLAVMTHNWVLVKKGAEAHVALDGLEKAQATGYVVPGDDVFAYTPMAAPGKTTEITFDAPAPGTYPYICTFPGHYVMMKGELTVTP